MRGHVRKRGTPGSWKYIVDVSLAAAQRCTACNRRLWIERRPKDACPVCGGELKETEERRRQTKAGFATKKECLAAMNKVLVERLGHATVSITLDTYSHAIPAMQGEAAERIAGLQFNGR